MTASLGNGMIVEKKVFELERFTTANGADLKSVRIGWESYGEGSDTLWMASDALGTRASRYGEVYAQWERDPQAFWAEAATEIEVFSWWTGGGEAAGPRDKRRVDLSAAITKAAARNLANEQLAELREALEVHEQLAEHVRRLVGAARRRAATAADHGDQPGRVRLRGRLRRRLVPLRRRGLLRLRRAPRETERQAEEGEEESGEEASDEQEAEASVE